ncbi:MAG TPA: PAS domain S-box protein [Roseiflexaceae bacterium]|nr:PAS domain S-box protein [Roseiflexaceae bacterium]
MADPYRFFFENTLDLLAIVGSNGFFLQLNPRWEQLLGYSREELLTRPLLDFVHPEDLPAMQAALGFWAAGQVLAEPLECRLRCRDGGYRWLRWTGTPDLSHALAYAVARDITDRKQAEDQARKQAQVLDMILNNAGDGVIAVDEAGGLMIFNQAAVRMFGSGPVTDDASQWAQIYGNFLPDMVTPFPTEQLPMTRAMHGEETDNVEMFVRHAGCPDGSWISVTGRPLRDEQGNLRGGVVVCRDITERKRAEEAQRQTLIQEEVIRAQQAALAELSTPLIPISDSVMVMPLIGTVDSYRVHQVMNTLLNGVAANRARVVILDITGVSVVDTQVANALVQAAQSVKLLGAQVMLTGIRPEVAQTLVSLGVDLSAMTTRSTLQSGVALAIGMMRSETRR